MTRPRQPQFALKVGRTPTGLGLFADEDVPKGRFIAEYWGPVVPDEEADRVGGKYLFTLGNGKSILGASRRNVARYANHGCRPNAEARQVGNRVYLFSRKRITPGSEITYDYGKDYFEGIIEPMGCLCRSCLRKASRRRAVRAARSRRNSPSRYPPVRRPRNRPSRSRPHRP